MRGLTKRMATTKEKPKIENTIEEYNGEIKDLVGYQEITGHMVFVFDIKMGNNFRQGQVCYVADGHKTRHLLVLSYTALSYLGI